MADTVGVIGLGQMGLPMARNLLSAGFDVVGFDVDGARVDALVAAGGRGAASPREVADASDRALTSLPSPAALRTVMTGDDGVLAAETPLILVETSTLELADKEWAHDVAEGSRVTVLDCPLSGTGGQAITGDLVVLASGDAEAVAACADLFDGFSRQHFALGEFGAGSKMKFLANLLVAVHNVAAAEAMVLGKRAGLDPQLCYDVLTAGAGSSRMLEIRGPMMVADDYEQAGIASKVFAKDRQVIGAFARSLHCPVPLFAAADQVYESALAAGHGDLEAGVVCRVLEGWAGLREA